MYRAVSALRPPARWGCRITGAGPSALASRSSARPAAAAPAGRPLKLKMPGRIPLGGGCSPTLMQLDTRRGLMLTRHAASSSSSWFPPQEQGAPNTSSSSSSSSSASSRLAQELSWQPVLTTGQDMGVLAAASVVCTLVYVCTAPARLSLPYAAGMTVLYGWLIWLIRSTLIERQYQARTRMFSDLGDDDSLFARVHGLQVHAKASVHTGLRTRLTEELQQAFSHPSAGANKHGVATSNNGGAVQAPPAKQQQQQQQERQQAVSAGSTMLDVVGVHCYHGFGANLYSYSPVQARLANALQAVVTSHDMPGFGLTERPKSTASYFLTFNGQLGDQVLQHEVGRVLRAAVEAASHASGGPGTTSSAQHSAQVGVQGDRMGTDGRSALAEQRAAAWQKAAALKAHPLVDWEEEDVEDGVQQGGGATGMLRAPSPVSVLQSEEMGVLSRNASSTGGSSSEQPTTPSSTCSSAFSTDGHGEQQQQQQLHQLLQGVAVRVRKVLVGHSMGGICAALEALQDPRQVAAIILVAPAIMAMPDDQTPQYVLQSLNSEPHASGQKPPHTFKNDQVERFCCTGVVEGAADAGAGGEAGPGGKQLRFWDRLVRVLKALAQAALLLMTLAVLNIMRPIIITLLRTLVRSRGFWQKGLQQAYYDPSQVTDQVVDAYRVPQLVRGWEAGMFMFLTARLVHTTDWRALGGHLAAGLWAASPSVEQRMAAEELGLPHRLALLSQQHGTPILIIHGVHDRLVPASNSRRLAAMLPGAELAVLKRCGHMPQEELPELFVDLVHDFMQRRAAGGKAGQVLSLAAAMVDS